MKIATHLRAAAGGPVEANRNSQGSVLMIIILTVGIIGVAFASYLNLVGNQNLSTMRSQQWNSAIPVAEAGIEEALTHLHYNPTNRGTDGWTLAGTNYVKERMLGLDKFVAFISTTTPPIITAMGYVQIPNKNAYIEPPRTLRVGTTNDALFAKGMVAKGNIDLSGNNIKTDSFDSADPNHSTGGVYDPSKNKDGGDVATNSGLVNSFTAGNADIHGHASTGPGGTISLGANGGVGSAAWHAAGNHGIQSGWVSDDMNVDFPDVRAPFNGGASTPVGATVAGEHYEYVLGSGNYEKGSINLTGQSRILVTGNAVLFVKDEFQVSGQSSIIIAPGASLKLYVAAASASLGGNGIINNSGNALNFSYYGLPSNTSLSLSGNASFTGTIYAPQAAFTLGGGGNDTYDFVGASVTGTVRMNGHFNFHYDENLGRLGPKRGFTVISWNEI